MIERREPKAENKGNGHKGMDGECVSSKRLLAGYDKPHFDPLDQGGLLKQQQEPSGYVRPPGFRGNPEGLTPNDVKGIYMENKSPERLGFAETDSGLEAEFFLFDDKGEFVYAMNPGNRKLGISADPFRSVLDSYNDALPPSEKLGCAVEMTANCVEIAVDHGTDIQARNKNYLKTLKTLVEIAEDTGVRVTPIANIPHRRLEKEEITRDRYTEKLTFDIQGWDAAEHFDIASIQPHVEVIEHDAARRAVNEFQHISSILLAATLSGPFMDGRLKPDPQERYSTAPGIEGDSWKETTIENLEEGEHQSYRPKGRFFGSPSGGILRQPIPVDESEFLQSIGKKLENGEVPTAGREGGHHTDRYRVDIPPHGTIEICTMDPAGGRTERVVALRELVRGIGWKMQMHFINGDFESVRDRYPALFGQEPSEESFEKAHYNSMRVAKHGADAELEGMDGEIYTTRQLWYQLREFVQEPLVDKEKKINYQGLPAGMIEEINRAFIDPSGLFDVYKDTDGYTSVEGFYQTGVGNISQWMMQGAKDRVNNGVDEKQAIMAVTVDVGKSFHKHVLNTSPEDINNLYANAIQVRPLPEKVANYLWENQIERNVAPIKNGEYSQLGHLVELPPKLAGDMAEGAKATLDILTRGITEAGGITPWMEETPVKFGEDIVLNSLAVNKQLDERIATGFGLPMEYDILLARDSNGTPVPRVVEIHSAISYETSIAEMLKSMGQNPEAEHTRYGIESPAAVYRGLSEEFADGEQILVMDTDPFDSTKADKAGMQKLMKGIFPISPLDIEGKDEKGYWYHPYLEDPGQVNEVLRGSDGKPLKDITKIEYAKNVFCRMAQEDLNKLWDKVKDDPQKVQLIGDFLQDGGVNWLWHPTWQHLGDKALMPAVRQALLDQKNPLADQFVPIFGPGQKVEPGTYIKKPTSAQGGIDQMEVTIGADEEIVEEGYVYQGKINLYPILTHMPGRIAAQTRQSTQETLRERDLKAGEHMRPVTGILEARFLIPPGWDMKSGEPVGRFMARSAFRWKSPSERKHPQTNVSGITQSIKAHLGENFDADRKRVPFGWAPVVVYEAN